MDIDQQMRDVAANYLANPSDVTRHVNKATVVDADGNLNQAALEAQLKNLTVISPRLRKVEAGDVDWHKASLEEFGAEMARRGLSVRGYLPHRRH